MKSVVQKVKRRHGSNVVISVIKRIPIREVIVPITKGEQERGEHAYNPEIS